MTDAPDTPIPGPSQRGLLGLIERLGNRLPDPIVLFVGATIIVMALSAIGAGHGWTVQPVTPRMVNGAVTLVPSEALPLRPVSLLTSDGIYWLLANLVRNFLAFPPLGVVLVCMMGIGVAEKTGLFHAAMRWLAGVMPRRLLTPTVLTIGFMSHIGADSGFVVVPPLAAGLYAACGRSPVAGVVVAFAGIAGGFSANLLVSSIDAIIAPLTEAGAQLVDPKYRVLPTCNWYFMAASTLLLTGVGWLVTAKIVEPALAGRPAEFGATEDPTELAPRERRALLWTLVAALVTFGGLAALVLYPGAPLYGDAPATTGGGPTTHRWTSAIVALIFIAFLVPGIVYGVLTGTVRSARDVSAAFVSAMASMAPMVALAFFAAQFIECFKHSQLDAMLAHIGGKALVASGLPRPLMLIGLIVLVMSINLLIPSLSAKWTALAGVLVPMLMMAGVSPELTQATARIGASVTNPVTPFNPYIIISLAVAQRYQKDMGLGGFIALTVPYSVAFLIGWTVFLLAWIALGVPLGPGGHPLWYVPGAG